MAECNCKFKIIEVWRGTERRLLSTRRDIVQVYLLQCSKCGDVMERWIHIPEDARTITQFKSKAKVDNG